MRTRPIVAIDGPAGAGKSTVAKRVAQALGFVLLDTGALYRAVALAAKRGGVDVNDANRAGALAEDLARRSAIRLEPERVTLDGEDVSREIRTPDMGMDASTVSAHPAVRKALLDMQRKAGEDGGIVAEGRDIGTVVFPDAEHKFFLTASAEVRARRRFEELVAKGQKVTEEETLAEVKRRDAQDEGRVVAPLKPAPDAELVDSSSMV
ncbi:MAG TPA: (d)CMP kinase, partial [Polyangiaceae bacterium]|nr:(d)CMP kinase [Polyangiaceae bacterium]